MLSQPNILVCTDFSSYSDLALEAAERIKTETHGHLHILHVSPSPMYWDWMPSDGMPKYLNEKFEAELLVALDKSMAQQMKKCHASGEKHISLGIPAAIIQEEILDKKIDLVIMGHKGKSEGIFHLGSLAEKIISTAAVPTLIVKKKFAPSKIAALVDPSQAMKQILTTTEEFAFLFSSTIAVISLLPDITSRFIGIGKLGFSTELLSLSEEQKAEIRHTIKTSIKSYLTRYADPELIVDISVEKKLAFHLNALMEEHLVDLAVVKRHQSDFLEKVLIGSETRRLLEIFNGNILVLPS